MKKNKNIFSLTKSKTTSLMLATILLVSTMTMLSSSELINAQDQVTPRAFLSVRPTTIGVGQEALINLWITPAPGAHRQYHNYTITFIDPDGKEQSYTLDSYVASGTMWMPWFPDKVGNWTIKFDYPGETFEAGRYIDGKITDATTGGSVYTQDITIKSASATDVKIIVQEEFVPQWPYGSVPTDYWTRPVGEEHRDWWPFLGAYPWMGYGNVTMWDTLYPDTNPTYNSAYGFIPWVPGPESAHIAWKREYTLGGLMGGDFGSVSSINTDTMGQDSSYSSDWRMTPTVILMGRAYHTIVKPATDGPRAQTYWECYDIRTGEIIWERPLYDGETAPTTIEYQLSGMEVVGSMPKPYNPMLISISNGYLRKYNANSGLLIANISIAPMTGTGGTYFKNGHVLGVQDLGASAGEERYRLIEWTTFGTSNDFTSRVVSNTTYARSALPTGQLTDWNEGVGCTIASISNGGIFVGQNITAFDLYTGRQLWNKYIEEPQYSGSASLADHGKLAVLSANGYYLCFNLRNGKQLWKTETLDYPWDASGFGAYAMTSAYGQFYRSAQSGIYAIDWETGKINWKYEKEAPAFETPYTGRQGQTVYPFVMGTLCADGKLFAYAAEHTPDPPFARGQPTVCIDVFTGEEIWSISGIKGARDISRGDFAVADGYLPLGANNGNMYVFGKGQSETTVTAQQQIDRSLLVTGTVLDLSPAQPGTPCVSFDSMATMMAHIHLQTPITGVWNNETIIGVPVSIDATGPNGEHIHIADVTTDGYSGTFAYTWQPPTEGQYTITATFRGDASYGSSFATTYAVSSAAIETPEPEQPPYGWYIAGAAIATITVLIIGIILILRKINNKLT